MTVDYVCKSRYYYLFCTAKWDLVVSTWSIECFRHDLEPNAQFGGIVCVNDMCFSNRPKILQHSNASPYFKLDGRKPNDKKQVVVKFQTLFLWIQINGVLNFSPMIPRGSGFAGLCTLRKKIPLNHVVVYSGPGRKKLHSRLTGCENLQLFAQCKLLSYSGTRPGCFQRVIIGVSFGKSGCLHMKDDMVFGLSTIPALLCRTGLGANGNRIRFPVRLCGPA